MNTPAGYQWHLCLNPVAYLLKTATHKQLVSSPDHQEDDEASLWYMLLLQQSVTTFEQSNQTFRTDTDIGIAEWFSENNLDEPLAERVYLRVSREGFTYEAALNAFFWEVTSRDRYIKQHDKEIWLKNTVCEVIAPYQAETLWSIGRWVKELSWPDVMRRYYDNPEHWHNLAIESPCHEVKDTFWELFQPVGVISNSRVRAWWGYLKTVFATEEVIND